MSTWKESVPRSLGFRKLSLCCFSSLGEVGWAIEGSRLKEMLLVTGAMAAKTVSLSCVPGIVPSIELAFLLFTSNKQQSQEWCCLTDVGMKAQGC